MKQGKEKKKAKWPKKALIFVSFTPINIYNNLISTIPSAIIPTWSKVVVCLISHANSPIGISHIVANDRVWRAAGRDLEGEPLATQIREGLPHDAPVLAHHDPVCVVTLDRHGTDIPRPGYIQQGYQ